MSERYLIWGAGGHGTVVRDVVLASGNEVVGWIDRSPNPVAGQSLPVVAESQIDSGSLPFGATRIALGVGNNGDRLAIYHRGRNAHSMPAIVHPSAVIGSAVTIGGGTVVLPGVIVNANARIAEAVILNSSSVVEHDCWIGEGAHLSPGAVLCGGVKIEPLAWIGAGVVVVPGVTIGRAAIVGAGSVVLKDVPEGVTVVGNPARQLAGAGLR